MFNRKVNSFFIIMFFSGLSSFSLAETMTLEQVLQQVIDHYPSVKTAAYQVEKAQQENIKVESQLSWQLGAQAGYTRDVSLFGTATDRVTLAGSLSRQLTSGDNLSIDASINREDASTSFSPTIPNPSTSTSINLNYRRPLEKGAENLSYELGLANAGASEKIAQADRLALYDQLASQVIELYLAAATTKVRLKNIDQSIERTRRLEKYIKERLELGVSEEKDILQVDAQLASQKADQQGLQVAWQKQNISLNRLMGKAWDHDLKISIIQTQLSADVSHAQLITQIKLRNPDLLRIKGRLQLADNKIKNSRDAKKDNMDLVLFIGNKTNNGDTMTGSVSESEVVGGVRLEFNRGIDKSGFDAELYQSQIERGIIIEDKRRVIEDLQYDLSSLLAEINAANDALEAYKNSAKSEQKKLTEAEQRYRRGRTDTDQIVQFEAQLSVAELAVKLQQIELARRYHNLSLLRGELWKNITLIDYLFSDDSFVKGK
jgi:outer membrane protein TolC